MRFAEEEKQLDRLKFRQKHLSRQGKLPALEKTYQGGSLLLVRLVYFYTVALAKKNSHAVKTIVHGG